MEAKASSSPATRRLDERSVHLAPLVRASLSVATRLMLVTRPEGMREREAPGGPNAHRGGTVRGRGGLRFHRPRLGGSAVRRRASDPARRRAGRGRRAADPGHGLAGAPGAPRGRSLRRMDPSDPRPRLLRGSAPGAAVVRQRQDVADRRIDDTGPGDRRRRRATPSSAASGGCRRSRPRSSSCITTSVGGSTRSPSTLDVPLGTVKSRIHYATSSLRAALEADARTTPASRERMA